MEAEKKRKEEARARAAEAARKLDAAAAAEKAAQEALAAVALADFVGGNNDDDYDDGDDDDSIYNDDDVDLDDYDIPLSLLEHKQPVLKKAVISAFFDTFMIDYTRLLEHSFIHFALIIHSMTRTFHFAEMEKARKAAKIKLEVAMMQLDDAKSAAAAAKEEEEKLLGGEGGNGGGGGGEEALVVYSEKVCKAVLEKNKVKLSVGRKRKGRREHIQEAFEEGKKEGQKVDVNTRAIRDKKRKGKKA